MATIENFITEVRDLEAAKGLCKKHGVKFVFCAESSRIGYRGTFGSLLSFKRDLSPIVVENRDTVSMYVSDMDKALLRRVKRL